MSSEITLKIKKILQKQQISQTEFANMVGSKPAMVSHWLKGKRNITIKNIKKIAVALNVPLAYLIDDSNNNVVNQKVLEDLDRLIQRRLKEGIDHPNQAKKSYVATISAKGKDAMLKKITEEAGEMILASKNNHQTNLIYETADLWFHSLLVLHHHGIDSSNVLAELNQRLGKSGIEEKNERRKLNN